MGNNIKLETIRITREEYNDYLMMKGFIFDNNYGMEFLMYEGVINQMKEAQLQQNDGENSNEQNLLN